MKKELLINSQLGLFFQNSISRPDELIQDLNKKLGNIFDQIPVVMPVPNEPEFMSLPVAQLSSSDGKYTCNIARSRADLIISAIGEQTYETIKSDTISKFKIFFSHFASQEIISRIGFVVRFFVADEKTDSVANLIINDLKKILPPEVIDTAIKHSTGDKLDIFDINNALMVSKGSLKINSQDVLGISITRDFNTKVSNDYSNNLNEGSLVKFIEAAENKFNLTEIKNLIWKE